MLKLRPLVLYRPTLAVCLLSVTLTFNSCITYRVQTKTQEATEVDSMRVNSWFWGIAQQPKRVMASTCDTLHLYGMSEVSIHRSFGHYMLSLLTVGMYNPAWLKWRCAKPKGKEGTMGAQVAKPRPASN